MREYKTIDYSKFREGDKVIFDFTGINTGAYTENMSNAKNVKGVLTYQKDKEGTKRDQWFICQNINPGNNCKDKHGFKHSWVLRNGRMFQSFAISNFKIGTNVPISKYIIKKRNERQRVF